MLSQVGYSEERVQSMATARMRLDSLIWCSPRNGDYVSDLSIAVTHIIFFLGRIFMCWEDLWLGLCTHQRILKSGLLSILAKKHLHFQI